MSDVNAAIPAAASATENSYWRNAALKLVSAAATMLRAIRPGGPVTGAELLATIARDRLFEASLLKLDIVIAATAADLAAEPNADRKAVRKKTELNPLLDAKIYFVADWRRIDPKTKSVIVSTLSNLIEDPAVDPVLAATFCGEQSSLCG